MVLGRTGKAPPFWTKPRNHGQPREKIGAQEKQMPVQNPEPSSRGHGGIVVVEKQLAPAIGRQTKEDAESRISASSQFS